MKKKFKSMLVVLIILVFFIVSGDVLANSFSMSEEQLDNALETFRKKINEEANEGTDILDEFMKIERQNDIIKITSISDEGEEEEFKFKYDFSKDCRFYVDTKYTKSMTYDEVVEVNDEAGAPMYGFLIMSVDKGNSLTDSAAYILIEELKNLVGANIFNPDEYTNGLEYANYILKNSPLDRTLYKIEYDKVSENNDEIVIRTSYVIKTEEDFTVVKGSLDNFLGSFEGTLGGNGEQNVTNDNKQEEKEDGKVLPEAGINITLVNSLKISIGLAAIAIVILLIKCLKSKEVRDE